MSKLANLYKFDRHKVIVFLPGLCLAREWLTPSWSMGRRWRRDVVFTPPSSSLLFIIVVIIISIIIIINCFSSVFFYYCVIFFI